MGTLTVTSDITPLHHAPRCSQAGRQEDRPAPPLLDRRRRARRRRCRARRARLRPQVLYRGRQLGPGRQQHAGVLRPRSAEVPRFHPHTEAPPEDQPALSRRRCGISGRCRRRACIRSPSCFPDRGLPHGCAPHPRLRLAHLQLHQRARRALLGEVPLQDQQGHQALDQRRGGRRSSARRARATQGDLFGAIEQRRLPELDAVACRS